MASEVNDDERRLFMLAGLMVALIFNGNTHLLQKTKIKNKTIGNFH